MPFSTEYMDNPHADRVRRIARLSQSRARQRSGLFLVEGPQSVRELVACRPKIVKDLYVQSQQGDTDHRRAVTEVIARILRHPNIPQIYVHYVSDAVMSQISDDSQGIVAVAEGETMQSQLHDVLESDHRDAPLTLAAFWQIRDPGNAGTVIRAADAAGCAAVIFVDDCVDALNPKVIRSTAGSIFHIPIIAMSAEGFLQSMHDADIAVVAADVHGVEGRESESLPTLIAGSTDKKESRVILFGNEARGLPESMLLQSQRIVFIPMYGKAESLNLATSAAIMLHTLAMSSHVERI
ncbi:MAG: RNA methyltransferase [Bifidobacterium sp.]|uniref:RNA methyltransferase n=1 Tax=Bifidobacterium fermentum TaxID=3059035 RepID=A0AB39UQH1_9BIFI